MAKDSAGKHKMKVAEWVTHAVIKTHQDEEDQTIHIENFSDLMEEYPDKEFMKNWFLDLKSKINELSKKLDENYKPKISQKSWWKLWS